MAFFSRTRIAAVSLTALIVGCGHLAFEDLPLAEGPGLDAGDDRTGPDVPDATGGTDGSAVDAGCVGPSCPGTYVSGTTGSDTNPGTGFAPVQTIAKAMTIAGALGGAQKVFVAGGHYPEKVTLVEKVDLLGGYDCKAAPCTWARDIRLNETAIDDTDFEGVLAPKNITRQTLLEGLRIVGHGGAPDTAPGSVAITLAGGSPTIRRCDIVGASTLGGLPNARRSVAVDVLAPSNSADGALLDRNTISSGTASDQSIGVLFDRRAGGAAASVAVATLTNNTIKGGTAPFTSGVVAWNSGAATLLQGNDITAGTSTGTGPGDSSWGIVVDSALTIDANRINVDQVNTGSCLPNNNAVFCGGIRSGSSTTFIRNNVVFGVKAPRSVAVFLTEAERAAGVVELNSNTLDGSGTGAGPMSAAIALRIGFGTNAVIGSIRNNILLGGTNKERYGVYEETSPSKTAHPSALDNNDFWNPLLIGRKDAAYRWYDGNVATVLTVAQLGLGTIVPAPSGNIGLDPLLDATYHLTAGAPSPCIDAATKIEAPPRDIDGDLRPKGAAGDIGADEAK